jgi:hypothetical protein
MENWTIQILLIYGQAKRDEQSESERMPNPTVNMPIYCRLGDIQS